MTKVNVIGPVPLVLLSVAAFCLFLLPCCGQPSSSPSATPSPTPVPSPAVTLPNQGVSNRVGLAPCGTNPSHSIGCAFVIPWFALETCDGGSNPNSSCYNWTPIANREATLGTGQILQVSILVGDMSPTTSGSPNTAQCPDCPSDESNWLVADGAATIPVYWDYPSPTDTLIYPACTVLNEPLPGDAVYVSKLEAFISAFDARFTPGGVPDPKIGLVTIMPFSHWGFDVSMAIQSNSTSCPASYNTDWQTATGVASEGSATDNVPGTWWYYITQNFQTLWNYEVSVLGPHFNIGLWAEPSQVADIAVAGGYDTALSEAMFQYAGTHLPGPSYLYYCGNESLNDTNGWELTVGGHCSYSGVRLIAQDHSAFYPNCSTLLSAYQTYGIPYGLEAGQVYTNDFNGCPSQIATISSLLGRP